MTSEPILVVDREYIRCTNCNDDYVESDVSEAYGAYIGDMSQYDGWLVHDRPILKLEKVWVFHSCECLYTSEDGPPPHVKVRAWQCPVCQQNHTFDEVVEDDDFEHGHGQWYSSEDAKIACRAHMSSEHGIGRRSVTVTLNAEPDIDADEARKLGIS